MIRVTFTYPQVIAMQYDAMGELELVKTGKSTMTFAASRETWEREYRMAGGAACAGGEWTQGYAKSAGCASGRIAKALARATKEG